MAIQVTKVSVWAGEISDQPGGLDKALAPMAEMGANLSCVIARREHGAPGTGVAFISPVRGERLESAARAAGFSPADDVPTLRVEGEDKPGLGHKITRAVADAGANMRGLSAMTLNGKFVAYLGFDDIEAADKAAQAIRGIKGVNGAAKPRSSAGRGKARGRARGYSRASSGKRRRASARR
jgi:hypothetical protein